MQRHFSRKRMRERSAGEREATWQAPRTLIDMSVVVVVVSVFASASWILSAPLPVAPVGVESFTSALA